MGQMKSGKNGIRHTQRGISYPTPQFKVWRESVMRQIKAQWKGAAINKPAAITIYYYPGDLRRRDVPGIEDALWHCFERSGVVVDDKLFTHVTFVTGSLDRKNPRVEVSINELVGRAA